jgi:hypothetical protein
MRLRVLDCICVPHRFRWLKDFPLFPISPISVCLAAAGLYVGQNVLVEQALDAGVLTDNGNEAARALLNDAATEYTEALKTFSTDPECVSDVAEAQKELGVR